MSAAAAAGAVRLPGSCVGAACARWRPVTGTELLHRLAVLARATTVVGLALVALSGLFAFGLNVLFDRWAGTMVDSAEGLTEERGGRGSSTRPPTRCPAPAVAAVWVPAVKDRRPEVVVRCPPR